MMLRRFALTTLALTAIGGQVAFAQTPAVHHCRDAKGKFTKCEKSHKPTQCRDAKGHFAPCSEKNTKKDAIKSDTKSEVKSEKASNDTSLSDEKIPMDHGNQ